MWNDLNLINVSLQFGKVALQNFFDDSSGLVHPFTILVVESLRTRNCATVPKLSVGSLCVHYNRVIQVVNSEDLFSHCVIQIVFLLEVLSYGGKLTDFAAGHFQILSFTCEVRNAESVPEREFE